MNTDDMTDTIKEKLEAAEAQAAAAGFSPEEIQAYITQQVADQVEGVATHLRNADLASLTDDVMGHARKHPALFIGGAALLGFAAARWLSARNPAEEDPTAEDPWAETAPAETVRGPDAKS